MAAALIALIQTLKRDGCYIHHARWKLNKATVRALRQTKAWVKAHILERD